LYSVLKFFYTYYENVAIKLVSMKTLWAGGMSQVVEDLPRKHQALSSNLKKEREKERKEGREGGREEERKGDRKERKKFRTLPMSSFIYF
jgi:hypothetical protein